MPIPRMAPRWVQDLMRKNNGHDLLFMMKKSFEESDRNGLHISSGLSQANIFPMLSESEKMAANLLKVHKQKKEAEETIKKEEEKIEEPEINEKIEGSLNITVYSRGGWWFCLDLKMTKSNGASIGGKEWKFAVAVMGIHTYDCVELWSFRQGADKKLCFVLGTVCSSI